MWKWILVGVGVLVGAAVVGVMIIAQVNPEGLADFVLTFAGNFNIEFDGMVQRVDLSRLGEGVEVADRSYVIKKVVLLRQMSETDKSLEGPCDEFKRAILAAAEDGILTRREFEELRRLHADIVSDDHVKHWLERIRELEERQNGRGDAAAGEKE